MRGNFRCALLIFFFCAFQGQCWLLSQDALAKPAPSASSRKLIPKPQYVLSLEPLPKATANTKSSPWGWVIYNKVVFNNVHHPKQPLLAVTSLKSPVLRRWIRHLSRGTELDYAQPGFVIPNFKYNDQDVAEFMQLCRKRGVQVVFLPIS